MLVSPEREGNTILENNVNCDRVSSVLYSKDYTIIPITGFFNNKYDKSFISITEGTNDDLRTDSIYLINNFVPEPIIVKYRNDDFITKIYTDGSEIPMNIKLYESESNENKIYIYNGVSFTLSDKKRYFFPKRKEDLKSGMIVEYFNNNKWIQKQISADVENDYQKMFKLLIKYEKVRVEF
jgi:hypothetical protein